MNLGELITVKKDSQQFEDKIVLKRIGYRVHSMVKLKGLRMAYKWYDVEPFDVSDTRDTVLYKKLESRLMDDMEIVGVIFEIYRLYEMGVVLFKEIVKTPNLSIEDFKNAYGVDYLNMLEKEEKEEVEKHIEKVAPEAMTINAA